MPTSAEIQSRYDISVRAVTFDEGVYEIDSDLGGLELRLFAPGGEMSLDHWIALLEFLHKNRFPAPRLIETINGDPASEWEDGSGVLTSIVSGESPSYEPEFFHGLGTAVGQLHTLDTTHADLPEASYSVRSERRQFIEQDGDPAVRAWEGYDSTRDDLIAAWDRMPDFDDHPGVLINTGVFEWGAILTREGVALKNWQEAGKGPAVIDIGPLFAFQGLMPDPDGPLRPSVAGAFLHGYRSTRQLTPLEMEQLPDAIAFGALTYAVER